MTEPDFTTFSRSDADGVARIVFDNPPLNLVTPKMIEERNCSPWGSGRLTA